MYLRLGLTLSKLIQINRPLDPGAVGAAGQGGGASQSSSYSADSAAENREDLVLSLAPLSS